jgi:hypothetical protein
MSTQLTWKFYQRRPGVWLKVSISTPPPPFVDEELDEIGRWCTDNSCGWRMSYDLWRFKNHEQVTLFLLKWS